MSATLKNRETKPPSAARKHDPGERSKKRGSMSILLNKSGVTINAEDGAIIVVPVVLALIAVTAIVIFIMGRTM